MSKKILFFLLLISVDVFAAAIEPASSKELKGRLTIQFFDPSRDAGDLKELIEAHLTTDARDLRGRFEDFMTSYWNATALGLKDSTDDIFREHGLFYQSEEGGKPKLVGYIVVDYLKAELTAPNHGECTMLLHPAFRGKGYGTAFRKLFLAQLVAPRVGKKIRVGRYAVDLPIILPAVETFLGVKSFVDILNVASRKVLNKSGYSIYDLYANNKGTEIQIVYLYPPAESLLAPEIVSLVQENTLAQRARITEEAMIRQKEHDYFRDLSNHAGKAWAEGGEKRRILDVYKSMKRTARVTGNPFSEERFWVFINLCKLTSKDRELLEKMVTENAGDFARGLAALREEPEGEAARAGAGGAGASAK